jgi:hypothetical protein
LQLMSSIMTNSESSVMKAALAALRATWSSDANSEFVPGHTKTTENHKNLISYYVC